MLFKCMWADTTNDKGFRKDAWGFHIVNFNRLIHTGKHVDHEPLIYASQAQMVYFVEDQLFLNWSIVVHLRPRDLYDMGELVDDEICEHEPFTEQELNNFFDNDDKNIQLAREEEYAHLEGPSLAFNVGEDDDMPE